MTPTGESPLGGVPPLVWVPHSCSPHGWGLSLSGVTLLLGGSPRPQSLRMPPFGMEYLLPGACLQLRFQCCASHLSRLPLALLNLPEVLGSSGLFLLVSELAGTGYDRLRAASHLGHCCSPLLPKPCRWCPICSCSADFSNLVLKFYAAKSGAQTDLNLRC